MNHKHPVAAKLKIGPPAPLTRDDLPTLANGARTTTSVQRMRASHHKVARLMAHGFTQKEAAAATGYTPMRVSQLCGSPAMVELIAIYRDKLAEREDEELDAVTNLMGQNLLAAQRHIADTFDEADENNELVPVRTALAVASDAADRLGYSKHTSQTNVNLTFGAELEKAIARSGKGPMINSVAVRAVSGPRPTHLPSTNSLAEEPRRPLVLRRA